MSPELVVPAFALVLAANAILIALAIRTFTGERSRDAIGARETRAVDAPAVGPGSVNEPSADVPPAAQAVIPPPDVEAAADAGRADGTSATTTGATRTRPKGRATPRAAAAGRRQRFELPPMDEDHGRFNRSIATFLAGGKSSND
jgi:hypothetical protein